MKTLVCVAPDGEYVTEWSGFKTVEDAWNRSDDMGSRWFFYPIHVVLGPKGKRIVDVPYGLGEGWIGKNFDTLRKVIAENSEEICAWINGDAPCPIYFHA